MGLPSTAARCVIVSEDADDADGVVMIAKYRKSLRPMSHVHYKSAT